MMDFKQHMHRSLKSARQWLRRAEESFDKDRDVRGELDLMLAQAELQRVKEQNRGRHWRYKYPFLAQAAALGAACLLAGGIYFWSHGQAVRIAPVPTAQEQFLPAADKKATVENAPAADKVSQAAAGQAAGNAPAKVESEVLPQKTADKSHTAEQLFTAQGKDAAEDNRTPAVQQIVSPNDMNKLVRAAGKTLRGQ